jgi:hypothetical protein
MAVPQEDKTLQGVDFNDSIPDTYMRNTKNVPAIDQSMQGVDFNDVVDDSVMKRPASTTARIDVIGKKKAYGQLGPFRIPLDTTAQDVNKATTQTEDNIANRYSNIKNTIMLGRKGLADQFRQHPFKTGLGTLGAFFEAGEGVPASVMLNAQRGETNPAKYLQDASAVLHGDRPAQLGDVAYASGNPTLQAFAPAIGLGASMAEGPTAALSRLKYVGKYLPDIHIPNPTQALGAGINDALGIVGKRIPIVSSQIQALGNKGTDWLAGMGSSMSGTAPQLTKDAIEHPEYLDPKYMSAWSERVKPEYDATIRSLENSPKAQLTLPKANALLDHTNPDGIGVKTAFGTDASKMQSMTEAEQNKLRTFMQGIQDASKNPTSFNDAKGLLNKMNKELQPYYTAIRKGELPKTDVFTALTSKLATGLRTDLGDAFESFGNVSKDMSAYMHANDVAHAFQVGKGSFFRSLPARVGMTAVGLPHPAAALAAFDLSSPVGQAAIIKNASKLNALGALPTITAERAISRQRKYDNSDQTE